MDYPKFIVSNQKEEVISIRGRDQNWLIFTATVGGKIKPTPCMCSPFSHLSIDVSTAHVVDTISLVKFTFAQTLLIGG